MVLFSVSYFRFSALTCKVSARRKRPQRGKERSQRAEEMLHLSQRGKERPQRGKERSQRAEEMLHRGKEKPQRKKRKAWARKSKA